MNGNDFILWPYPYSYGTIVGYFPETTDRDTAIKYLNTQKIEVMTPLGKITYPNNYTLIEHEGILVLICNCGIMNAHWIVSPVYRINLSEALAEFTSQITKLVYST